MSQRATYERAPYDPGEMATVQGQVTELVVNARTSFYWAMRLLPAEKRQAMFAIYAFCRVVDDIADGDLPPTAKLSRLESWREEIERLYGGAPRHPISRALAEPVRRYDLAREDFLAVIDGMKMDAEGGLVAPAMAELELYCARVAGAVGRLSVRVFGAPPEKDTALARSLGEAVQLTNILRDLAEDAELGRLYLPRELLLRQGVPPGPPAAALSHQQLPCVCEELASLAQRRFDEAAGLLAAMPRRPLRPARMILGIYQRLLRRIRQRGFIHLAEPVSLSKLEKLWLVLRYGLV